MDIPTDSRSKRKECREKNSVEERRSQVKPRKYTISKAKQLLFLSTAIRPAKRESKTK